MNPSHRLKLLFVATSFINRAAEHQANTPDNGRRAIVTPPRLPLACSVDTVMCGSLHP